MIRFFDILFSFSAILFLSPFLFLVSIILKFTGEGEVIYTQKRVGLNEKEFGLFKFATMLKNSPNIGSKELTLKNDPRVLPVGKFLRITKINELPQLFNILFGDISIVGPRPMVPNTFKLYPFDDREKLKTVKPGLTGIGSIIFRNEEKFLEDKSEPKKFYEKIIVPYKSSVEVWFVENNSIVLYFKCIVVTAWVIFFPESRIVDNMFRDLPKKPDALC